MKNKGVKYILALLCSNIISLCNAQQIIDSVKIIPLNPTTTDSIYVITSVTMATTSNGYLGYDLSTSGTIINIEACYKHGMLDAPQTYIDTINLGVKLIGEYTLNFIAYSTHFIPCDHSGTSDFQTIFIVTAPLGINESESKFTFSLFPNPISSSANLSFEILEDSDVELSIRDMQGKFINSLVVATLDAGANQIVIDMSHFSSGVYFLDLTINGDHFIEKLIKL